MGKVPRSLVPQTYAHVPVTVAGEAVRADWRQQAACRGLAEPDFFPSRGESPKPALAVCADCPVQAPCLVAGLWDHFGVRGGTTERTRRRLRKLLDPGRKYAPPPADDWVAGLLTTRTNERRWEATRANGNGRQATTVSTNGHGPISWNAAIAEAKGLAIGLDSSRWRIGDLLLVVAPPSRTGHKRGQLGTLRCFAEETRLEVRSCRDYRQTAANWPAEARVEGASYGAHRALLGRGLEPERRREILAQIVMMKGSARMMDVASVIGPRRVSRPAGEKALAKVVSDLLRETDPRTVASILRAQLDRVEAMAQGERTLEPMAS